jgi:hypothetical protein
LIAHAIAALVAVGASVAIAAPAAVALALIAVLAVHLGATRFVPRRAAFVMSGFAIVFAAVVPLWADSDAVDCYPRCSAYQDVIATLLVVAVVLVAADLVGAMLVTALRVLRRSGRAD